MRKSETADETESRRALDTQRIAETRQSENVNETERRRAVNRDNMAVRRHSATEKEFERRRLGDRQRKAFARQEASSKVPWAFNFALNYLPNKRYQDNPLFATGKYS
ncbi:hypothetical protein ElyMa_005489800 [Elysia marginata]|uniref:IBB domain-containing protein n=1 Tax=Elysia marginata TaxID=1093978 RepID=A0AAV4ERF8_9GAST|nr:hypothetical protein ElyMa_005489800 [Elysia marginata]